MPTSMFPTTPSKKVFTDDLKSSIDASNMHRNVFVPEDLNVALMSVGSKVRKSVTEGYNTQRISPASVPATPYSSPAKPPTTQCTPVPMFQTANDAFNSVFPPGTPRVALTPSPKKRPLAEVDSNDLEGRQPLDADIEMNGNDPEEEEVMVILGPEANTHAFSPRKIKPLRRLARPQYAPTDPFVGEHATASLAASPGQMYQETDMDLSGEGHRAPA